MAQGQVMTDWKKHIGNKVYIQSAESSLAFYLLVLISNDTCKLAINYIPWVLGGRGGALLHSQECWGGGRIRAQGQPGLGTLKKKKGLETLSQKTKNPVQNESSDTPQIQDTI